MTKTYTANSGVHFQRTKIPPRTKPLPIKTKAIVDRQIYKIDYLQNSQDSVSMKNYQLKTRSQNLRVCNLAKH